MAATLPRVGAGNLSQALVSAGARGVFLGFTAASCAYCASQEAAWAAYLAHAQADASASLPLLVRIDGDRDVALLHRHEIEDLPALALAWRDRHTLYTGPHTFAAMRAFGAAQLAPAAVELSGEDELLQLLEEQATVAINAPAEHDEPPPDPLLLLGFLNDPHDDESDERDDFVHAAGELRKLRPDVAVRGAYVRMTRSLADSFVRDRQWLLHAPSAVLLSAGNPPGCLVGCAFHGGAYRLDERDDSGLTLSEWAAQRALPVLGELTPLTFAAYAATSLPMLIAFVHPSFYGRSAPNATEVDAQGARRDKKKRRALQSSLRAVGERFRGQICVVTCDGIAQRTRMLTLGLSGDSPLPQLAFNTKDGRQLPFPLGRTPSEKALSHFTADFLGERLPPRPPRHTAPASPASPKPSREAAADSPESVVNVIPSTFDRVALDVTRDVLLLLTADIGCEPCKRLIPFYARVATRVHELGLSSTLRIAQFDVKRHAHELPAHLSPIQLHNLPIVIMLPAKRKAAPFSLFHGNARPKELLYFAQRHASFPFELPPNPHLTREQHTVWKEQVAQLPAEKVEKAYETLQRETGLLRDEL